MPIPEERSYHLNTLPAHPAPGRAVLCLPGLFAGGWVFDALLPLIAARGYPASALSYRGHPPLGARRDIGRQSVADYLHDAADAAEFLHRPIVIAHSMGGLVAMLLAKQDLIGAGVLVSPAPPRGISVLSPTILARMIKHIPALLSSRPFQPTTADADAMVLNRVPVASRHVIRQRFVADSGRAAREMAIGTHDVPREAIHIPLLVVGSDDDRFIPPGVSRRVAQRYRARFHLAEGHGHFLFSEPGWEAQAAFMLDWIDSLPGTIRGAGVDASISPLRENLSPAPRVDTDSRSHPEQT